MLPTKCWQDIPMFPSIAWEVDVGWSYLDGHLENHVEWGLELDPDFQRAHVWTPAQRVAWLEYVLRGGEVGRTLVCATNDWSRVVERGRGDFYALVDGKQRLESVRAFMRGEIAVFPDAACPAGYRRSQMTGVLREFKCSLRWRVVETPTRLDVLNLYLQINAGGTPHTPEELARVRALVEQERGRAAGARPRKTT